MPPRKAKARVARGQNAGRPRRGGRGGSASCALATPTPHESSDRERESERLTATPAPTKIVELKSESRVFKALLVKLEIEDSLFHRSSLVVKLRVENGKAREYLRTVAVDEAEQRTSSTKARLQSPATVKDKPIEAPDLRFIYVDQLPTPGSSSNSHKAEPEEMAPTEKADVDDELKSVIQSLYEIQSITAGYLPNSAPQLSSAFHTLTNNLSTLNNLTLPSSHPSSTTTSAIQSRMIPDSILDYVDAGRNPDIYTREFVELDQRGNACLNGKMTAFADFSRVLAGEIKDGTEGVDWEVDKILETYGLASEGPEAATAALPDAAGQQNGAQAQIQTQQAAAGKAESAAGADRPKESQR